MISTFAVLGLAAGFAAVTVVCCVLALAYARRRQLVDQPGERRSHSVATPRGGGAGIVLAVLLAALAACWLLPGWRVELGVACLGLLLVAGIGWWDDHRPLPALLRLCVHMLAGSLLGWLLWRDGAGAAWALLGFALCVGLVNVWNFMDGINGLAASQAALAALALAVVMPAPQGLAGVLVAVACLAFLPFNFPRARIFMGDVGSGALGYLLACLVLLGLRCAPDVPPPLLLWPLSVFLIDAAFTLMIRIWRGEAWMQAHTEHLYQWYVKSGYSHARVTSGYAVASLLMCLMMLAMEGQGVWMVVAATVVLWGLGALCWQCLRHGLKQRA